MTFYHAERVYDLTAYRHSVPIFIFFVFDRAITGLATSCLYMVFFFTLHFTVYTLLNKILFPSEVPN